MLSQYIFLVLAILFEVIGTTAMAASQQFTKLVPVVILIVSYGLAFYFLSITPKNAPPWASHMQCGQDWASYLSLWSDMSPWARNSTLPP